MNSNARRALSALVALVVVGLIAMTVDWAHLLDVLSRASMPLLLLAAGLYLPSWLLRGFRWQKMAEQIGSRVPLIWATAAATTGNLLNLILPAKAGDLLWANAAHLRWQIPYGPAIVGVLSGRVLDLVVLSLMGVAALSAFPGAAREWGGSIGAALASGTLAAGLGWLFFLKWRLGAGLLRGPLARLRPLHDALVEPAAALFQSGPRSALFLACTALIWLDEAAVAWLAARSLGVEVSPGAVLSAIMIANLSKIIPVTPMSFGTYEAAGAAALQLAGAEYTAAFAALLVEHLLKNAVNALLGLIAMAVEDIPVFEIDVQALREGWRGEIAKPPITSAPEPPPAP